MHLDNQPIIQFFIQYSVPWHQCAPTSPTDDTGTNSTSTLHWPRCTNIATLAIDGEREVSHRLLYSFASANIRHIIKLLP